MIVMKYELTYTEINTVIYTELKVESDFFAVTFHHPPKKPKAE